MNPAIKMIREFVRRGASLIFNDIKGFEDCQIYIIQVIVYISIPKPKNLIAFRFQPSGSTKVLFFLIEVVVSVKFNNQLTAWSAKVYNETTDWMLAAKMNIIDLE